VVCACGAPFYQPGALSRRRTFGPYFGLRPQQSVSIGRSAHEGRGAEATVLHVMIMTHVDVVLLMTRTIEFLNVKDVLADNARHVVCVVFV